MDKGGQGQPHLVEGFLNAGPRAGVASIHIYTPSPQYLPPADVTSDSNKGCALSRLGGPNR